MPAYGAPTSKEMEHRGSSSGTTGWWGRRGENWGVELEGGAEGDADAAAAMLGPRFGKRKAQATPTVSGRQWKSGQHYRLWWQACEGLHLAATLTYDFA